MPPSPTEQQQQPPNKEQEPKKEEEGYREDVEAILTQIRISLRNAAGTFGTESRQYRDIAGILREEGRYKLARAVGIASDSGEGGKGRGKRDARDLRAERPTTRQSSCPV